MIDSTTTTPAPVKRKHTGRWQFTFSTLLVGMFVFAIFFGYSGWWWQRMVKARREYDLRVHQLEMALDEQARINRQLKSQTQLLESQLKDSIEVRFGEELSGRVTAESDLQEAGIIYAKLRADFDRVCREREQLAAQLDAANERLADAERVTDKTISNDEQ